MKKKSACFVIPVVLIVLCAAGCGYELNPPPAGAEMQVPVARTDWAFGEIPGKKLASDHYRIYTTSKNPTVLDYLPGFLEAARASYLALTGLAPTSSARSMSVYMFATRQQWVVMTDRVTRPMQETYLQIENGGYCFGGVCVFWDLHHPATFAIAAHEGLHQFFHHQLRDRIPAWSEEGLCTLAEGMTLAGTSVRFHPDRNVSRLLDLRRAIGGKSLIPLDRLLSTDAGDHIGKGHNVGPEYYGQLWALLNFIRSDPQTNAGLQRLLADAAAGRLRRELNVPRTLARGRDYNRAVSVPVFKHYIAKDLATFEQNFHAYARKLAKME